MDFGLDNEQRLILATVREFVTRDLLPLEAEAQRAELDGRSFPGQTDIRRLQQKAKTAGLWGLLTPEEYGGANLGMLMTALISMETSKALIPFSYGGYADNILYVGNAEQKQRYLVPTIEGDRTSCFALTEPDTGSDATNIQMPAVRDGSDWVLNGRKVFITNGLEADFAIVFAVTDKNKGHQEGVTAFLVDRTMGWSSQPIQTMGAWRPAEINFDGVRVPEENVLGEVGEGFKVAMSALDSGRYSVAAGCVGICQGCVEESVSYAKEREQFGRPIASFQLVQAMIADMVLKTEASRMLVWRAGWLKDMGRPNTLETSIAKLHATEASLECANLAIQVHGGAGYVDDHPVERYFRDARVTTLYEGTSQIQKLIIGRAMTGINALVPA